MGASLTPYTQKLSRKGHRKSRLGCKTCKRRRVKCDEIKPHCTNCLRHSIECDYSSQPQTDSNSTPPSQQSDSVSPQSQGPSTDSYTFYSSTPTNFRPPKRGHGTSHTSEPDPLPPNNDLVKRPFQYTALDMLLFHHFSTSPELTGAQPKARQQLSQIAFAHHYVMHILLAFSGFHLVRRSDDQQWSQSMGFTETEIYTEAERHFNVAVRDVSAILPHLDRDNSPAMYVSAIFIFISSLARGPQPGEYLAFRSDGDPGHLSLFLGVRSVFELCSGDMPTSVFAIHGEVNSSAPASDKPRNETQGDGSESTSQRWTKLGDYRHHLETYRALLMASIPIEDSKLPIYLQTLDRLRDSLDVIFGSHQGTIGMALFPLVFAWLYQLPDAVVGDLQRREPVALIMFAFFLYLLDRLDHVWFIYGWPRHILEGIRMHLDTEYSGYIQWAVDHIGTSTDGIGASTQVISR
ncbi:transcription factor [Aspergillus tubingensis]